MTTKVIRAEHLLWMAPVLFVCMIYISSSLDKMMVYYLGEYFMISYSFITGFFLIALLIPFLLHILLRRIGLRNQMISWMHILLSIFMAVAISFIFNKNLPVNVNWRYHVGELGSFHTWEYYNSMGLLFVRFFLLLQILFSVYGLTTLGIYYITRISRHNTAVENNSYEDSAAEYPQQMIA
ncbi:MAG: hypothetical protein JNK08_12500 [Sediminibacterium sp.]|nr:hypothetical protein [Sediminibacterium sp.]